MSAAHATTIDADGMRARRLRAFMALPPLVRTWHERVSVGGGAQKSFSDPLDGPALDAVCEHEPRRGRLLVARPALRPREGARSVGRTCPSRSLAAAVASAARVGLRPSASGDAG